MQPVWTRLHRSAVLGSAVFLNVFLEITHARADLAGVFLHVAFYLQLTVVQYLAGNFLGCAFGFFDSAFQGYRVLIRGARDFNLYTTSVNNTQNGLQMIDATTLSIFAILN